MNKILNLLTFGAVLTAISGAVISPAFADNDNNKIEKKQKNSKAAVIFRDGSSITEDDIKKDMEDIPDQLSAKMSLMEIKSLLAWKAAYKKILINAAKKSGVGDKKDVKNIIEKRKETAAGFMLLESKSKELMTDDALKNHYNKIWDKNFKGTKEFTLVALTTSDKNIANNLKKSVKDEQSLKKTLDANASSVKSMDMESRPQGMFPAEISDAVLKQGVNSIVGPFEIQGSFMLFYVKNIADAKKQEFTEEFAENYKKVASKEFVADYMKTLYKKYKVKVMDTNGKEVDPFKIIDKEDKKDKKDKKASKSENLLKVEDTKVLASLEGDKVTVDDVKKFFKVESLLDETFLSMAQQFEIKPEEVIIYAVKLVVDDKLLAKEVTALKFDQNPENKEKLSEIENMEIIHAYYNQEVNVKSEDVKRTFDKFMKSIPEEDKNDNEISVKLAFFSTQEDAAQALKSINSGEEKFGNIFKEKTSDKKKTAIDLGYVKKKGTSPELWGLLKRGASGACCKEIVELSGKQFEIDGNYAIVYIADRRPVTLPSLSNPQEKKYFEKMAKKDKAVALAKSHMLSGVKTIDGKPIEELNKNPEYVDHMLAVLVGYAG